MKTADEVGKGLAYDIALCWCKEQHQQCDKAEEIIPLIAQALTAYADERVRNTVIESFGPEYRKIRAEALEEAAKLSESGCSPRCNSYGYEDLCPYVNTAKEIRALKDKK